MANRKKLIRRVQDPQVSKALLGDFFPEDIHTYRVDRHNFIVYLGGDPNAHTEGDNSEPGVEFNMADRFERNLDMLSGIDPERSILIKMSSCGGYWEEGMKIFGAILTCPNPVTVLGTKWCRSMTSIIPLAADKFVIRPPAQYMFHHGTYAINKTVQEVKTDMVEMEKQTEMMLRIYVARLKSQGIHKSDSEEDIKKMLSDYMEKKIDVWLSADEAQRWGFTDGVFEGNRKTLRATKVNTARRERMRAVLREKLRFIPSKIG